MSIEEAVVEEARKMRAKILLEVSLELRGRAGMHARQRDEIIARGGYLHEAGAEHDRSEALLGAAQRLAAQIEGPRSVPVSDIRDEARQALQAILTGSQNIERAAADDRFKKDVAIVVRNVDRLDDVLRRVGLLLAERG
jgi:hypothetical protein